MTPTAHFVDISHYEADVDFHTLAGAGACPLVITKCSEGSSYTDPTFADFAKRVRTVPGLIFGSYVFLDAGDPSPQVAHYLSTAHLQPGDLQPVVDAEAAGLTRQQTFDALHQLETRGYRPILYCSCDYFANTLGSPTRWWLWLMSYKKTLPALPAGVRLWAWQHTDAAVFPGVARPCDGNYLYVPVADLKTQFCV